MKQLTSSLLRYLFLLLAILQLGGMVHAQLGTSTAYVYAGSGLKLRKTPSLEGEKLATIPYGAKVACLEGSVPMQPFIVDGLSGNWQKIKYAGKVGFVFDGYLAPLPAPDRTGRVWVTLEDYANNYLHEKGKWKQLNENVFGNPDSAQARPGSVKAFDYGIDFYSYSEECADYEVMHCRNLNLQQAFLLTTAWLANYRDISLNVPTELREHPDTGEPARFAVLPIAPDLFQLERYLFLCPKAEGGWEKIHLAFDSEPGNGTMEIEAYGEGGVVITFQYGCH